MRDLKNRRKLQDKSQIKFTKITLRPQTFVNVLKSDVGRIKTRRERDCRRAVKLFTVFTSSGYYTTISLETHTQNGRFNNVITEITLIKRTRDCSIYFENSFGSTRRTVFRGERVKM